jgi:hypothetical protein
MIISTLYITALLLTAATAFTAFHVPSRYAVRNRVLMKEDCALAVISQAIKSKEVPKAEVSYYSISIPLFHVLCKSQTQL